MHAKNGIVTMISTTVHQKSYKPFRVENTNYATYAYLAEFS